ncbi:MAG: protein kinase [Sandaracinaceae bacterium]|nr:protein kinase [Sandaracinaceae bacterium]
MSEGQASKLVGTVVADRYRVERKLAAGGMGVVYLAEQVPLGRMVALKILDTQALDEEHARNFGDRFFLEAAAVAKLQHPNTITVYDFGKAPEDIYYYAMEYVDGASMANRVHSKGPLDAGAAIHVGLQVCGSLREAHLAGLIHRDLKPGNIMLTERLDDPFFVKVLDFGLVKVMGDDEVEASDLTQSGMLLGSPRYMAPEQVLRFELDSRCDIYALGGVLYHALTGYPPFRHGSQFEVLRAQVEERPAPLAEVYPFTKVTPRLEALIFRCLEKERRDRPQDMAEVAAELVECAREIGLDASLGGAMRGQVSSPGHSIPPELRSNPGMSQPGLSQPGLSQPGMSQPGMSQPGLSHPGLSQPGMSQPGLSHSSASQASWSATSTSGVRTMGPTPHGSVASVVAPAPQRSSAAPLILGGLALLAILAAGAGVFAMAAFGGDDPTPVAQAEPTPPAPAPDPEPIVAPPPPDEPTAAAPAPVRIETDPPGARVRRGEVDLGDAPFNLEIPEGEQWELTVSLEGHETRTVLALPGRDVLHVRLTAVAAAPAPSHPTHHVARPAPTPQPLVAPPPTPAPAPTPRFQDRGDLRHPWGH